MRVATSPGRCAATRAVSSASAASPACSPSSSRRRQETIAGRSSLAAASAISPRSKSTTVCEARRPVARREELRQALGVVGDRHRRLGVVEHVGALLGSVGDEDAGGNRSRRDRGEIGDRPLRPVRREDGEPRPRHHAELARSRPRRGRSGRDSRARRSSPSRPRLRCASAGRSPNSSAARSSAAITVPCGPLVIFVGLLASRFCRIGILFEIDREAQDGGTSAAPARSVGEIEDEQDPKREYDPRRSHQLGACYGSRSPSLDAGDRSDCGDQNGDAEPGEPAHGFKP